MRITFVGRCSCRAGYLNRPEKTAEVFIKNPYDGGEYENAYKTGDIVGYRADGNIKFVVRRDGQVKFHGFHVELTEVEAVIREFLTVKNSAQSKRQSQSPRPAQPEQTAKEDDVKRSLNSLEKIVD